MSSSEALRQSPVLARCGVARDGKTTDRIDDVRPALVVEPESEQSVADLLAWASQERLTVVFRGGGTKLGWGRPPTPLHLLISLRRLNRVLAHEHADLTATVEAGATLDELNAALGRHRQWLPLDPSSDGVTVGGAIATNDSGPLRHRYGTPHDLLIGVRLATTDGRVVKAGGNVVKNVAGYDLGKLVSGSFGTLAAIVSATFKLLPVPAASRTLIAAFPGRDAVARAVTSLNDSQLEPVAVELQAAGPGAGSPRRGSPWGANGPPYDTPYYLLVRFAGASAATDAQVGQAQTLLGPGDVLSGDQEAAAWRRYAGRASASAGSVIKMSWLPAALPEVLALVEDVRASAGPDASVELAARAAIGSGQLRIDGNTAWQASVVQRLRAQPQLVRHVTLRDASAALKEQVDVWGPAGPAVTLAGALKRALDPAGILNANRGPV